MDTDERDTERTTAEAAPARKETCEDRIGAEFAGTMKTVRRLWKWEQQGRGDEVHPKEETTLSEYGLSADYVAPGTFGDDQDEGYFRWQLSWGGPSDEFRFYVSPHRHGFAPYRIEYRFHDWFDGAGVDLSGEDFEILGWVFEWLWSDPAHAMDEAS